MSHWLVVPIALASAGFFALSARWKHQSASQSPPATSLRGDAVAALVRATLTHRLWLGGIVADAVGLSLQIVALHLGALSTVECLLVSGLLFALLLRHGSTPTRTELAWAGVLAGALIAFALVTGMSSSVPHEAADRLPVVIAAVIGGVVAAACVAAAARNHNRRRTGVLLGVTVGVIYAATAALLKSVTNIVTDRGPLAAVVSWQIVAVIVLGAAGLTLSQIAFQSGPLSASLPTISTVDPLLSVAIGVLVFEEHLNGSLTRTVLLAPCLTAIAVAVWRLSSVAADPSAHDGQPESAAPVPLQLVNA